MAQKKVPAASNSSKEELLHYYREMLLIRRFEEKAGQLYGMGLIGGFCHLYIGQEAVVVGLEAAAKEGDKRITSYRDHGHMLACGMDPKGVMAELTGRSGGLGKDSSGQRFTSVSTLGSVLRVLATISGRTWCDSNKMVASRPTASASSCAPPG